MNARKMSDAAASGVEPGSAVWLDLPTSRYPWWPAMVHGEGDQTFFLSFKDEIRYEYGAVKVRCYNCMELSDMITKGKHKLRNRKGDLELYCQALQEVEKYIRTNLDSTFTLKSHSFLKATTAAMEGSGKTPGKESASKGKSSRKTPVDSTKDTNPTKDSSPAKKDPANNGIGKNKRKLSEVNQRSGGAAKAAVSKKVKLNEGNEGCVVEQATTSAPWKWDLETRTDVCVIESTERNPVDSSQATDAGEGSTATKEGEEADPPQPTNENEADTTNGDGSKEGQVSVAGNSLPLGDIAEASVSIPAHGRGSIEISQVGSTSWSNVNPLSTAINIPPLDFSSPVTMTTPTSARKYCSLSSSSEDEAFPNLDSDSEEEDWPCLDLSVNENIKIHELKQKDVLWVKYGKSPFWPAMVSTVCARKKKKSAATSNVYFFGYNEPYPTKIKSQSIYLFGTEKTETFIREGKNQKGARKIEFEQALKEAQAFCLDVSDGKWSKETPKEVMIEVAKRRPLSYVSNLKPEDKAGWETVMPLAGHATSSPRSESPMFVPSWLGTTADSDDDAAEVAEDEEDDDDSFFPYTYERVVTEIEALEPVLMGIMRGEVESNFHKIFLYGSRKEQTQLKYSAKYGPIKKWPAGRMAILVKSVLTKMARKVEGQNFRFTYAHDVLLPEAMIRVKASVEKISIEQAVEEFEK